MRPWSIMNKLAQQLTLDFPGGVPVLADFAAHKARCPRVKGALVESARWLLEQAGGACLRGRLDIHTVYGLARLQHGIHCGRSLLPGYAREIEAENPELRFQTRRCRFDEGRAAA